MTTLLAISIIYTENNGYVEIFGNCYRTDTVFFETKLNLSDDTDVITLSLNIVYRHIPESVYLLKADEANKMQQKKESDL